MTRLALVRPAEELIVDEKRGERWRVQLWRKPGGYYCYGELAGRRVFVSHDFADPYLPMMIVRKDIDALEALMSAGGPS